MKKYIFYLYHLYSFIFNVCYILMELLPPLIRKLIFKIILGKFGKDSWIDYRTYMRYPRKVSIGSNSIINRGCEFYPSIYKKGHSIIIGNNVAIAPGVTIFSAGHDYTQIDLPVKTGVVKIHDYVWIGGKSIILPDVEIGEGAIIGAGSVLSKDIPPYTVAVGNPAEVIKNRYDHK